MNISHCSPSAEHAIAVPTPCCPAPVSAITLFLPIFFANNAWPKVLFVL
jgi:hypothetical protein